MKVHRWDDVKRRRLSAAKVKQIEEEVHREVLEMTLQEVRQMLGKTQAEVSEVTRIAQGELSKLERRDDHLLSTLRRYVEALGGTLEVVADFGDKKITLKGV